MPYLLDTNVWIHYFKQPASPIHAKLSLLRPGDVVTCSIVKSELMHGAEKYAQRDRRQALIRETLAPYRSLPFDDDAAIIYASLRHDLKVAGNVIGPYDLQIATICQLHGLTLVTQQHPRILTRRRLENRRLDSRLKQVVIISVARAALATFPWNQSAVPCSTNCSARRKRRRKSSRRSTASLASKTNP